MGEIFGAGVQDLTYGVTQRPALRVFDVRRGALSDPGGLWLDDEALTAWCEQMELPQVPVLYRGPFDEALMLELTEGLETVSGRAAHMREGVVVRPLKERRDEVLGRVQLKSVSGSYLTRKGGTEYT